ncbi:L-threonylcarbamoyladenylate synthase [Burkholderia sp. Bp8998]|uniref:L-threonylcarbamoyladenylate synthase n=1 Tax=Burkholderia sp. Bp8998 TaxID=2184557 RepID=UPI000F59F4CA|nr:L-threonylcarbamoyladenylate synthase [Burkholderia sp. Bp8998]RQS09995.1 threonylcarbamoyl-AMP synthase [Burkholderia sp. Bp8998]
MLPNAHAARILKRGGILMVPTDTNYAFAADPWNESACARLYEIKKRDVKKPLTLFVSRPQEVWAYAELAGSPADTVRELMARHWPGPLNFVLPKSAGAPAHRYLKEDSISVVCNRNPVLNELIELFGKPLAMTSANLSGIEHDCLIDYELASRTFPDAVDFIVPPAAGKPTTTKSSTIVSVLDGTLKVLRHGDIVIA